MTKKRLLRDMIINHVVSLLIMIAMLYILLESKDINNFTIYISMGLFPVFIYNIYSSYKYYKKEPSTDPDVSIRFQKYLSSDKKAELLTYLIESEILSELKADVVINGRNS